jgi:two-component system, NarL family, invasion response regulator UvrY
MKTGLERLLNAKTVGQWLIYACASCKRVMPISRYLECPNTPASTMINVAIIDDHAIVRAGLKQFLGDQPDMRVVAEGGSGRDVVDILRAGVANVILLDVAMPGQNGVDALAAVRARDPNMAVLMLSAFPAEQYATVLLRQGASGYLNKDCDPDEIVTAIRTVASGRKYITPAVAQLLATQLSGEDQRPGHERLSERELQVFLRLAQGETIGTIADHLSLSVKTVSTFRSRVMEKLKLQSNSDLTYYALKHGLIT